MIVSINQELCNNCGICGHVCPRHIPETINKGDKKITVISPERIGLCMECGHCCAVCDKRAIYVESLNEEKFVPMQKLDIDDNQFLLFLNLLFLFLFLPFSFSKSPLLILRGVFLLSEH